MKTTQHYLKASDIIRLIRQKKSAFWSLEQRKRSLELFHNAANRVPAYKKFLKKHNMAERVKNWQEFQLLPLTNKKNYLNRYPLGDLCWNAELKQPLIFTATSGSTGTPFYFLRDNNLDWQYSVLIEQFLQNSLGSDSGPHLAIVCFGMGIWIGGLITYKALEIAALRLNYPLSIITPGINKKEIFSALKNLAPYYKNVILVGYPPFIKDIIDESSLNGINLKKLNIKLIFAAEAFSEKFRDYLVEKVKVKNLHVDTMNIYGTADIGAMAYETPLSILIRRIASQKPELFNDIFGSISKTPTLAQFNPLFINFESVNGEIILTGDNAIPLVRYGVGDHGGVYTYQEMSELLKKHAIDIAAEAKKAGIARTLNQLPFVFVFERNDFSVTLYGLQIYPEIIKEVLLKKPLSHYFTGKLTLETRFNSKQDEHLVIHLETKKSQPRLPKAMKKVALKVIVEQLELKNSEYRELHKFLGRRALPQLQFWQAEDPEHFKPGIKQKWVRK